MVKLAILWHMHQPYYEDRATGEHMLPWVRLHAIKDYWGMVALLGEFPGVKATFNLVPSLLVQVEAFAADRAADRYLALGLKPAEALEPGEQAFLVANGFHAPYDRMIRPHPRYAELYAKRARGEPFTVDELRDLQVLQKLAWMDPDWLATDERLRRLFARQRDFHEDDKWRLREVELELLNAVIPAYRAAAATGRVELSTSPFYHPILPLLCTTDVHFRAHPHSALPRGLFAWRGDAEAQLVRAAEAHARWFGAAPRGVWPSEGSVSDDVIELLASGEWQWTATDEEILARSLQRRLEPGDLYRPYEVGPDGRTVRVLFRDHELSDLIGFVYQSWDPEEAAGDFVARVRAAGASHRQHTGEVPIVTVILDGENAWEHYAGGGRPFLRALYRRLQEAPDIETVTMQEAALAPARRLASIFPGSWINGDFDIWAGHADDHLAWAQLAAARRTFESVRGELDEAAAAGAYEELLIAEGSDWFWWYGDDHSSEHDREFDDLFRRHLRNVYRAIGRPVPDELYLTNISTVAAAAGPVRLDALSRPAIDGRAGDFTQWTAAAIVPLGHGAGTMHRGGDQLIRELRVAADRQRLYLRIDGPDLVERLRRGELSLAILTDGPDRLVVPLPMSSGSAGDSEGAHSVAEEIVTAAVPFAALQAQAGDRLRLSILVLDGSGHVVEQQPEPAFEIAAPTRHHDAYHWMV